MTHNPIASLPTNRLQALWHDVGRLTAHLRFPTLQPWEAQRLGGFLFPGASELVTKVGRALLYHPDLFHDGAATAAIGKGLLHRQARADALLALRTAAPQTRQDLEVAFDEPFRLQAKRQQAKLAGQKTIQPAAQQQADAEQAAAETQLIDTFTRFVQQNP